MRILRPSWKPEDLKILKGFRNSRDVQRLSRNFSLFTDDKEEVLVSGKFGLVMRIRKGGYVPRSGLLIAEQLRMQGDIGRALDIGTGETGFLANCLIALGATQVIASDIDKTAIEWARQASNRSAEISWFICDLFPAHLAEGTFDTIVSNPPQMPMPQEGHPHDYGGPDGRSQIARIIEGSKRLLSREGKLIMLCFDFLGIERAHGQHTIIEIAKSQGLSTKVIGRHRRTIRRGGKTEENIGWIESICPGFLFQKDESGNFFHEVLILEMQHVSS